MTIICLYTHAHDLSSLKEFKSSCIYKNLKQNKKYLVVDVLGDNPTDEFDSDTNTLKLNCNDRYDQLSLKTYKMIKFCVENFKFKNIIKIDPNILSYSNKKHIFLNNNVLRYFYNEQRLKDIVLNEDSRHYFGSQMITYVSKKNYEIWADSKKLTNIDFYKEFTHEKFPIFYTGKVYGISYDFARFISLYGFNIAKNHIQNLGGSEDTFVGRMFQKYYKNDNWNYDDVWLDSFKESIEVLRLN